MNAASYVMDYIVLPVLTWFDTILFTLIGIVYELLMRIADATFFNQDVFREFSTRIYSLLGIFMLFRLTFSLITYTINPDDLTEKSKGVQNIISRILITLILLIVTPTIFVRARELQKIILDNNVLESVILGIGASGKNVADPNSVAGVGDTKNTAGSRMSFILLSAVLQPQKEIFPDCSSGMYLSGGVNTACLNSLNGKQTSNGVPLGSYVETAWKYKDVSILLDPDLIRASDSSGQKYMGYWYIISTFAAGFVCIILISFCIDVAVRSVKLGFLELIAPIPILMNIDPKASKDSTFNKWTKLVLSTYLDLFLRLAAIYFCIFILDNIDLVTGVSGGFAVDAAVKVFIILGALTFAKQIPKLIGDLTGIKIDEKFTINPLKKVAEVPVAGAVASRAIGGVDSMAHGNGFWQGVKRNSDIPFGGGDGKRGIFDTADHRLRKEVMKKRDLAQDRYGARREQGERLAAEKTGEKLNNSVNSALDAEARRRFGPASSGDDWKRRDNEGYSIYKANTAASQFSDGTYRKSYFNVELAKANERVDRNNASELDRQLTTVLSTNHFATHGDLTVRVRQWNSDHTETSLVDKTFTSEEDLRKELEAIQGKAASSASKVDYNKKVHETSMKGNAADAARERALDDWSKTH